MIPQRAHHKEVTPRVRPKPVRNITEPVHVPGHLIPKPCQMCKREIVRTPTPHGIVHVDLDTIKFYVPNQHQPISGFFGTPHDCVVTRRET